MSTTPTDLLGIREACRLVPSSRPGKRLHAKTLLRWVLTGRVTGYRIGRYWYVSRAELLGLPRPVAAPAGAVSAETMEVLRRHGLA